MSKSKERVWVVCPDCGEGRRVSRRRAHDIEVGKVSDKCRSCARELAWRSQLPTMGKGRQDLDNGNYILWNTAKGRRVEVFCAPCGKTRRMFAFAVRFRLANGTFTGFCRRHRTWIGGRVQDGRGYMMVYLSSLSSGDQQLAQSMTTNRKYVREHRLVMAKHLNRPLETHEIVHHKNGVITDNRIENLELRTQGNHAKGYGEPFYQLWQEAESHCFELEGTLDKILSGVFS